MAVSYRPILVLGGARSGKSRFAESLVQDSGLAPIYLATGRARDEEMSDRIDLHRQRRGENWTTVEEPLDLAGTLTREARPDRAILIDCLTLWITNLMMEGEDVSVHGERLCAHVGSLPGMLTFVSNEVGLGIVPDNRMARDFRDHAGWLHQKLAGQCAQLYFVVAGIPTKIKG